MAQVARSALAVNGAHGERARLKCERAEAMMTAGFVPHAERIAAAGAHPMRWMLVLHGIFGSAANFRTFARTLARTRPGWGFVAVDLRAHGQSQGAPPPHTVAAAAEDLARLEEDLGLDVQGVAGHSLGGKVALAYAERRARALSEVWILDSQPGARQADHQLMQVASETPTVRRLEYRHAINHDKGEAPCTTPFSWPLRSSAGSGIALTRLPPEMWRRPW